MGAASAILLAMKRRHFLPLLLAAALPACHSLSGDLCAAMEVGDQATVQAIVAGEDDSWKCDSVEYAGRDYSLLAYACAWGRVEAVELLLENGPEPNDPQLAWGCAVRRDSLPIVRALYAHGLKPLKLHELLRYAPSAEMVDELMDQGADPLHIEDNMAIVSMRFFPLCSPVNEAAFKTMVERVGWQNIPLDKQELILKQAVFHGDHVERLRFLMNQGLNLNMKLDGKGLQEYAAALVPLELIEVPRALKCRNLLKEKRH